AVMTLMARDIRRAGYWGGASFTTGSLSGIGVGSDNFIDRNPFWEVKIPTSGCILYSYDRNSSGTREAAERYGFMLSNNAILMRTGVGTTEPDCTTAVENGWDTLTDTKITQIISLTFTPTLSAPVYLSDTPGPNMKTRLVTIEIEGRSLTDATVKQKLTETVKLANDFFSKE
ncbi:MAG: hypothetical protein K9J77_12430, partial [Rhodoferax sp.]|nr:hypothetical protein [Rhodoferax sp.]